MFPHCSNHKIKKGKGYSLPQVLISVVITTILSTVVSTNLWPAVDEAKLKSLSKYLIDLSNTVSAYRYESFSALEDSNLDGDYLDDAIQLNIVKPVPSSVFNDFNGLLIKVHKAEIGGYPIFYLRIKTSNDTDGKMIRETLIESGFRNFFKQEDG